MRILEIYERTATDNKLLEEVPLDPWCRSVIEKVYDAILDSLEGERTLVVKTRMEE
jgi:hypothetical protein